MAGFREDLETHLKTFRSAPFLFVGAGVSRRYLGIDDWDSLLQRLAQLAGRPYDYYVATGAGSPPAIATAIASDLHEPWWSGRRFAPTRKKYAGKLKTPESALKAEASEYLADSLANLPKRGSLADELDLLRAVVIDGIITTNFDPLLENLFPEFRVFVGQEELLFNDPQGVGELYKIHGSHEAPDSLVLTRRDYDRFQESNPYLASKLMTIFVEHPVVFLGYSMSDPNVATILQGIVSCLKTAERVDKLADRLIFAEWDPDIGAPTKTKTVIPVEGSQIPVVALGVPDFVDVFTALGSVTRAFPARLLRQLKEQVFQLVLDKDSKERLFVQDLDPTQDPRDVDVVFGVGAIGQLRSYVGLKRDDLIRDVLEDGKTYDPLRIVQETLPEILSHPGNVPIYKYLRAGKLLDDQGNPANPGSLDVKVERHIARRAKRLGVLESHKDWARRRVRTASTLSKLIAAESPDNVLACIPALDEDKLDPGALKRFLLANADPHHSQWVKMVCLYDWLVYGRQLKPRRRVRKRKSPPRKRPK